MVMAVLLADLAFYGVWHFRLQLKSTAFEIVGILVV
jgi:hypothetical protein